ncbi:hypothetical protein GCM10009790_22510 [Georgenia ruanii]
MWPCVFIVMGSSSSVRVARHNNRRDEEPASGGLVAARKEQLVLLGASPAHVCEVSARGGSRHVPVRPVSASGDDGVPTRRRRHNGGGHVAPPAGDVTTAVGDSPGPVAPPAGGGPPGRSPRCHCPHSYLGDPAVVAPR